MASVAVVVDGARVSATGNVSEAYNGLFDALRDRGHAVITARAPLGTHSTLVLFEPGLWHQDLLQWWWTTWRHQFPAVRVCAYIDDVVGTMRACKALRAKLIDATTFRLCGIGILTPYPGIVASALHTTGLKLDVHHIPHGVAPAFLATDAPVAGRKHTCLVWGSRAPDEYPGRAALAALHPATPYVTVLPAPVYGAAGVAQRRVPPDRIVAAMDECTSSYAGGDLPQVLTSKHFEAAARGCCVITGKRQAAYARMHFGLHFYGADTTDDVVELASVLRPGEHEIENARIVRSAWTSGHVADMLLAAVALPT